MFGFSSASYDTHKRECHLSEENRYTRPKASQSNPIFDYIENQCASTGMKQQFPLLSQGF